MLWCRLYMSTIRGALDQNQYMQNQKVWEDFKQLIIWWEEVPMMPTLWWHCDPGWSILLTYVQIELIASLSLGCRSCSCHCSLIPGSLDWLRFMSLPFIPSPVWTRLISPLSFVSFAGFDGLLLLIPLAVRMCWAMVCVCERSKGDTVVSVWNLRTGSSWACDGVSTLLVPAPPACFTCLVCKGCSAAQIRVIRWEIRWPVNTRVKG